MGKQGRRCKQLLDDLKEMRGCWKLKEEALYCNVWSTRCGRGYGPVIRQTTEWTPVGQRVLPCIQAYTLCS